MRFLTALAVIAMTVVLLAATAVFALVLIPLAVAGILYFYLRGKVKAAKKGRQKEFVYYFEHR
ncbi:MAG: hypothetical protein HYY37_03825 [Candidatus Aenigmarchaeota archaeon]|nr:hypothetical protein [Candidatus Aenigmarchaeota archaeon]